jgi:hypothetical protein
MSMVCPSVLHFLAVMFYFFTRTFYFSFAPCSFLIFIGVFLWVKNHWGFHHQCHPRVDLCWWSFLIHIMIFLAVVWQVVFSRVSGHSWILFMRLWVSFIPIAVGFDSVLEENRGHSLIPARWEGSSYFPQCGLHQIHMGVRWKSWLST